VPAGDVDAVEAGVAMKGDVDVKDEEDRNWFMVSFGRIAVGFSALSPSHPLLTVPDP